MPGFLKTVGAFISGNGAEVIESIGDAVDKNFTSKRELEVKAMEIALEEMQIDKELKLAQTQVNKEEAKHSSIFVAGWRPFIGWVCGAALFYNFIFIHILCYIMEYAAPDLVCPEPIQLEHLFPIITGMLGISGLRTYEKIKGVEAKGVRLK